MTKLEKLLEIAYREKIEVLYKPLKRYSNSKLRGLYIWDQIAPCIVLDDSLKNNNRLHVCVLAEELGHHFSGIRKNFMVTDTYHERILVGKDETGAMRWATDFLIPDDELIYAVSKLKLRSLWELAEYFEVTEPFMRRKLGFIRTGFRFTVNRMLRLDIDTIFWGPCEANSLHSQVCE